MQQEPRLFLVAAGAPTLGTEAQLRGGPLDGLNLQLPRLYTILCLHFAGRDHVYQIIASVRGEPVQGIVCGVLYEDQIERSQEHQPDRGITVASYFHVHSITGPWKSPWTGLPAG